MFAAIARYFQESNEEIRKVSWPTRRDTIKYTMVVVGVTVFLGVFFAAIDYGLTYGLQKLVELKNS